MKKEIIQAIKKDTLYDFIASNYVKLTSEELKDLLLEYIYALYKTGYDTNKIIEEIKERWS